MLFAEASDLVSGVAVHVLDGQGEFLQKVIAVDAKSIDLTA